MFGVLFSKLESDFINDFAFEHRTTPLGRLGRYKEPHFTAKETEIKREHNRATVFKFIFNERVI